MQFRNAHILPCICYCLTVWISFLTWDRGSCACDIMSPSHALGYEVFHVLYLAEISSIVIKCHEMKYGNYCKIHIFFNVRDYEIFIKRIYLSRHLWVMGLCIYDSQQFSQGVTNWLKGQILVEKVVNLYNNN